LYWEVIEVPTEDLKSKDSYYSFHLPDEVNRVKGVTAIILKETPDEKELPEIEKREGKNWIGLRIRNKGKITDIYINQLADGRLCIAIHGLKPMAGDRCLYVCSYISGKERSGRC